MSTMPFKSPEPEPHRGSATIGKLVKINGQIFSKEDLYVDGDVEGTIEALEHKLTIGPNGKIQAAVRAREVVILGQVKGNVEAQDRIDIRKDARLVGDIKTARIIIEDGAYFKGSIDIAKAEPVKDKGGIQQPALRPQQSTAAGAGHPSNSALSTATNIPVVTTAEAKR
ncbi:MAG: polymer-forming cytoskeletal protein [Acidobacteriota bacterium]|nr:polymer-forming cytoskeletal protein [Acidobacteriota bacterium]